LKIIMCLHRRGRS